MEEKKLRITIKSAHYYLEDTAPADEFGTNVPDTRSIKERLTEKSDTIEFVTEGILKETDETIEIHYDESELDGMAGCTTSLIFSKENPSTVSMVRKGISSANLTFEEEHRHLCLYETPFFPIEMSIFTYKVANNMDSNGGRLFLDYIIEIRGSMTERNKFSLLARSEKDDFS